MRNLLCILSACLVSGCFGFGTVESSAPIAPPASLTEPCGAPVSLPERALGDQEIEILWGRDRSGYRACGSKHAGLAEWVESAR